MAKTEIVKEFCILTKTLEELEYWEPVNINQLVWNHESKTYN